MKVKGGTTAKRVRRVVKGTRGHAKDLTTEAIQEALRLTETAQKGVRLRNRALILTSVGLGLRAAEIAALKWEYVTAGGVAKVLDDITLPAEIQKYGSKPITLPIAPGLKKALQAYLNERRKVKPNLKASDFIFHSQKHGRDKVSVSADGKVTATTVDHLNRQSIIDLFRRIYRQVPAAQGASSHSGRRYFITHLARGITSAGGSIQDLKEAARHRNLQTTLGYIAVSPQAQRAAIKSLVTRIGNPRAAPEESETV